MLTYPMLNGQPIDQWKVTDLKDELQRRNLPITGLKDDLVKRLLEAIQGEVLDGGENTSAETPPDEGLKGSEISRSVDASFYQASVQQNVEESVSEGMNQGEDIVICVTEPINGIVATTEVNQEVVIGTAEASQRTLDAVTEVESSLDDMAATNKHLCESIVVSLEPDLSGVTIVKEANSNSDCHNDIIEKTPEDDTSTKMTVDDVPSDATDIGIKLGVDMDRKMLEVNEEAGTIEASLRTSDAVTDVVSSLVDMAPTDENHSETYGTGLEPASSGVTIVKEANSNSDCHNDSIEKSPEDDTSTKMVVDGVPPDVTNNGIKLGVDVDRKTLEVSQGAGTAEACLRTFDAIAITDEIHGKTDGVGLESASVGNTKVKEVNPRSEIHDETIEKYLEDNTSKKMAVDDVPCDIANINTKLGVDVASKLLEQEDVPTPPDAIALHADYSDAGVVVAAESEDGTSKKIAIDDKLFGVIHANINLCADRECKIEQEKVPTANVDCNIEQEKVPTPPYDVALCADPNDANVAVTSESMILENSFSENTLICGKDYEDPRCTNGDCKLILCGPKDQVSEINPDPESQIKCVSIFHDSVSTNEKNNVEGNMNADNYDIELEAKHEMVKISSTIPSVGDCLQALDNDKEPHKNETTEELGFTSIMESDTKEDSPVGSSPEKLNLDQSSGDESMDEDVTNTKCDDLGGKAIVTSQHVFKEAMPIDTIVEGSAGDMKEVVADEKPPKPAEKRKPEDHKIAANDEQIKRRRRWDVNTVNICDQQASELIGTGTPKVFQSSFKRSFGRINSTANGDSPEERIVPPPQKPATTSLRIDRFVRPFTLKAAQEFLGKTGSISSFWMDHIKTHCFVTYSSVEEAVATRNAVYNLQWPPNNGSYLIAEFVDPQEVKFKLEPPPPSPVPATPNSATTPKLAPCQLSNADPTIAPHAAATSIGILPTPASLAKLPPTSNPGPARESLPPRPENLEPALKLDDLFKKTHAYPRIYYMPLSEEEVSAKHATRESNRRNRSYPKVIKGSSSRT
ncbi:hypothetical protein EJB05_11122 [Eragrostis curvula]|uniref:SAP domain-containing protein n=1 Tax=Eragrostis curvula TaxID=38414 RepID=A0A5J9VQI9_9POAL|nr:hypothetical protein EJB05_11122 [Eragrostis curvula]